MQKESEKMLKKRSFKTEIRKTDKNNKNEKKSNNIDNID